MGQWFTPSVIIAAISLLVSFAALVRTWRHEPEASWMHTSIVSDLPGIVPSLSGERGRMPVRMGMLSNDGDGDAFDVRVFGHDCIVRAYAWEKLKDGRWKIGERTMIPRVETANDDVKIAIWPPEGTDELPSDAAICIHWTKTPTRLRRCGYLTIPIAEMKDAWWEDKDWKVCHRIAGRIRERHAHRKFHRNPEDARNAPDPM